MRYDIVRHKQAVGIFFPLCILLGSCRLRCELVGVHCPGIGKGNIAHCFVRQGLVCRAGNAHAGEVKVIGAAGSEGELLVNCILRDLRLRYADKGVEGEKIEILQIFHRRIAGALRAEKNAAEVGVLFPVIGVQRLGKCLIVCIARNRLAVVGQDSLICDGLLRVEGEIQQIGVPLRISGILIQLIRFFTLLPQRGAKQIERQAAVRVGGYCRAVSYRFARLGRGEGDRNVCQRLPRRACPRSLTVYRIGIFCAILRRSTFRTAHGAVVVHALRHAGGFTGAYRQFFRAALGKGRCRQQRQHHAA